MKILVWGLSFVRGGIESFLINYMNSISMLDSNVIFDSIGFTEPVNKSDIISRNGNVYLIEGNKKKYLRNFFKNHSSEYDFLWCNYISLTDIDVVKYASRYGLKRIIVHSHSSFTMAKGIDKYYSLFKHRINKLIIDRLASDFWACSDKAAEWMFTKKIQQEKLVLISNAIDVGKFRLNNSLRKDVRSKLGWDNKVIIAFIGRLSVEKDPLFALETFKIILDSSKSFNLVYIGYPALIDILKQKVKEYKIDNYVTFLGLRNDIDVLLQGIDVVIMPSDFEGFPMVAIESQASGTPIFLSEEGITKQVKISNDVIFLKKKLGPELWAKWILNYNLTKKDNYNMMINSDYNLNSASKKILGIFYNMEVK